MPRSGWVTSRPRNMIVTLTLSLPEQEALDVALLGVVVVLGDLRAELDLADRDLLLVLAGGLLLLRLLVLVLGVVEHAADRRARLGGDLDQVEVALLRVGERVGGLDDPDLLAVLADSRTSGTRIRSLIRVWSRSGGRRSNLRGTGTSCDGGGASSGAGPCEMLRLDQRARV